MVNYLGRHVPDVSAVMQPMNELLKKEVVWIWGPEQQEAFGKVKQILSSDIL